MTHARADLTAARPRVAAAAVNGAQAAGWRWCRTLAAGVALLTPLIVAAQEAATVEVRVLAIRATTKNTDVSPQLKPLIDELRKSFKFTGYKLERDGNCKAAAGTGCAVDLLQDYRVEVTPRERKKESVCVRVVISKRIDGKDREFQSAGFTIAPGKFQLIGGPKFTLDGSDVLIIGVGAR
ncbi:MAG: hypothetical protein AB7Q17_12475 [Phycisphaerae bacterium]